MERGKIISLIGGFVVAILLLGGIIGGYIAYQRLASPVYSYPPYEHTEEYVIEEGQVLYLGVLPTQVLEGLPTQASEGQWYFGKVGFIFWMPGDTDKTGTAVVRSKGIFGYASGRTYLVPYSIRVLENNKIEVTIDGIISQGGVFPREVLNEGLLGRELAQYEQGLKSKAVR